LYHTQLSFIQLGGGIALGVQGKQKNRYSLFYTPEMRAARDTTVAVRTTTLQICSQSAIDITSQIWNIGAVLCDIIIAVCMTYYVGSGIPIVL
jgi:hypothetical protein